MTATLKRGRLPARHTLRTARSMRVMFQHLAALGAPPAQNQDYLTPLQKALSGPLLTAGGAVTADSPYGMFLNDQLGDCVCADTAHQVMLRTANASSLVIPTDAQVRALYSAVGGYVDGDPSTDQGCDETTMEQYLQTTGFCGQQSAGNGMIDPGELDHVKWGVQIFGGVRFGITVNQQMEEQFANRQPWTTPADPNDPNAGGHDVYAVAYDDAAGVFSVITWGGIAFVEYSLMAQPAFFQECHGSAWGDFITATGSAPNGLDLQQLLDDLPAVA